MNETYGANAASEKNVAEGQLSQAEALMNVAREETWEEHIQKAEELTKRGKISLAKPTVKFRNEQGEIMELRRPGDTTSALITSWFNRYPKQTTEIGGMMRESYEKGVPLRVLNIGVAQGQEALTYIQEASNMVGEDSVGDALDLELVEYASEIPMIDRDLSGKISSSSFDYLKKLYNSPKAHFGTPFQDFVKELKAKCEKRDVVLFNNVIQHLNYNVPKEQMLEDMENLADVVDDGGILCLTCVASVMNKAENSEVKELFEETLSMLNAKGFEEEDVMKFGEEKSGKPYGGIFRKNNIRR